MKGKLLAKQKYLEFTTGKWESLEDILNIYVEGSQLDKPEVSFHFYYFAGKKLYRNLKQLLAFAAECLIETCL
jgi:hypothetical protein